MIPSHILRPLRHWISIFNNKDLLKFNSFNDVEINVAEIDSLGPLIDSIKRKHSVDYYELVRKGEHVDEAKFTTDQGYYNRCIAAVGSISSVMLTLAELECNPDLVDEIVASIEPIIL